MKIELRSLRIPDAVPLAKLANNEKVSRYLRDRFPAPYEPEHALSFIQCCHANEEDGMAMVRAVTAEGKLVGIVECVFHIDVDSRNGDVGYWLGEPYWHKGIAREALRQFTDLIFTQHSEIWRLSASILQPNTASMKAAESAGYVQEAVLRQAAYKHEALMDVYLYAILRNQWQQMVVNRGKAGIM